MLSPRSQMGATTDTMPYDQHTNQWMREALKSRQIIEELKLQNDKMQRELYAMNSKMNLMYEACGDLGITDRVGDLMQKKIREFQMAQAAQAHNLNPLNNSPRMNKRTNLDPKPDESCICGSSAFQEVAAFSSSYEGLFARENFHRKNLFDAEEARYRERFDIFGNPKQPSPAVAECTVTRGDTIDTLLSNVGNLNDQRYYGPVSSPTAKPLASKHKIQNM